MEALLNQVLLIAALPAGALLVAVLYLVTTSLFRGKKDGYKFESDGPADARAYKAGHPVQ